jgi:DMSO/TMAO reductase YedYZ molybdopterin-dependent catalytic subunit
VGFFERNRREVEAMGFDPARLPPGQYLTNRFPVLHVGDVPEYSPGAWSLRIFGLVGREVTLGFDDLVSMPVTETVCDIHCVTKWSRFDTRWRGVRVRDVLALAGPLDTADHVMMHADEGYTTNLPLSDVLGDDCLVTWEHDGTPLEPEHGGPVRMVVPHLYFWKSAKWLRGIELIAGDAPGFWERNGYHMRGDPFHEQRHWGD